MAEGGAHLSSATPTSGAPSIFEVLAQESLMGAVRPALRHAVKVLADSKPAQFGWLYRYYEETYTLLELILQNHFLRKFGGSFSENFYGLQRVCVGQAVPASPGLPTSQHRLSLLTLVLLPYLRQWLEQRYEAIENTLAGQFSGNQSSVAATQRLYRAVYPYLHTLYEGTLLCYQLAYVFGRTQWHSPLLQLSGVNLQAQCPGDLQHFSLTASHSSSRGGVAYWSRRALSYLAVTLSSGLSVGVFFLQFLDWWYSSNQNSTSLTALPVPPAPQKSNLTQAADGVCPLCQRSRSNDTVLSVSGYVFCYPCVYGYVKQNGTCPVTSYPCNTDHLVKLYLPNS